MKLCATTKLIATLAAVFMATAIAQTPAPSAAPVLTKPNCIKPELPESGRTIVQTRMDTLINETKTYKECVAAFALEQKTRAEQQQQAAQATIASANAAIKEYNEFIEESNKATGATKAEKKEDKKP
jgi:hypothetical protein